MGASRTRDLVFGSSTQSEPAPNSSTLAPVGTATGGPNTPLTGSMRWIWLGFWVSTHTEPAPAIALLGSASRCNVCSTVIVSGSTATTVRSARVGIQRRLSCSAGNPAWFPSPIVDEACPLPDSRERGVAAERPNVVSERQGRNRVEAG